MNGTTDWVSAFAILAAGLIAGTMIIYFAGRRKKSPRELETKRDALLAQIRALDDGDERRRLELEAAHVLRQLDRKGGSSLRYVWVSVAVGAMFVVGALVYFVNTQSSPDDLESRIQLARTYVERNDMRALAEQTEYILAKAPDDSRALTYHALVLMSTGDNNGALQMLQKALANDPNFLDAYVTTSWLLLQNGRGAEAEETMKKALELHPEEAPRLQPIFDEIRKHRDIVARPPIRISLDLVAKPRGGVIYVIARPAGIATGHPVAVRRIDAGSLPTTIDFGDADSMIGEPLPDPLRIEARLDGDGDVVTKDAADPFAMQDRVALGDSIRLSLR